MVVVASRIPHGVFCLDSALYFHELVQLQHHAKETGRTVAETLQYNATE
ncbi:MAG: hypothetical protein H6686_06580 [Fibrobacteria bacterium]|nr:hypothetical protein [Fibrobacteria bacterium]